MVLDDFKKKKSDIVIPSMLYGTAWKEDNTQKLVFNALQAGFQGIDTANQRKHYFEEGVGLGIQQFLKISSIVRSDLFLQTKFTFADGQDHRKPYDESQAIKIQVKQSFESSLNHLQTDYIDSYVLHGPSSSHKIASPDWEAWQAMEDLFHEGKTKCLGISNVNLSQLEALYSGSSIKPRFVQNRCFAISQWDKEIRYFCEQHGIIYQGFSLLTANQRQLSCSAMQLLSKKYEKTIPQIVFRFALQIGILSLTGTSNQQHMRDDLGTGDFILTPDELKKIENIKLY